MASIGSNEFECPVCLSLYTVPKLLSCYHLACRDCVLSWLQRTGGRGECPVCRAPILSATSQGQGQLGAQVDKLQTDLVTQALVDGHKILTGPHLCEICPINVVGQGFCLQCSVKLCTSCTLHHQKLPATSHHTVHQLSRLTVSLLAARHQVKCQTHSHKVAKLYCTSHSELICHRCGSTTHRGCPEVKELEDVAKEERQNLKERLDRMKMKEMKMTEQVSGVNEQFTTMRKKAKDVFDGLVESIEKRRRDVNNLIQAQEDAMKPLLADVDKVRVSTALPRRNMETLVLDSPADGLLAMRQQLASRLDKLESQLKVKDDVRDMGCLVFDDQIITRLKADLENLGQIQQSQPTSPPAAGVTTTTSATASGLLQHPQSHPKSPPAAGATAATSATASGQIQQPQTQPASTPAAGATATTGATASVKKKPLRQKKRSHPTSPPAAGATATTNATASGQIQQPQPTSPPAAVATATTSATASGQIQQPQPTSSPPAGATATTSATVSGQIQQSKPTSPPAAGAIATTSATASGPGTAVKPQGAALARVLKVGDRVRLAPGALGILFMGTSGLSGVQPRDRGSVTAIPSRLSAAWGCDPQGWVDVGWDKAGELSHRMGRDDNFDLVLA